MLFMQAANPQCANRSAQAKPRHPLRQLQRPMPPPPSQPAALQIEQAKQDEYFHFFFLISNAENFRSK
jgi:hypothetical protein